MMRSLVVVVTCMISIHTLSAQGGAPDIQQLVTQVNAGADDAVREQLPSLISKYPNNPGVLYLQALLTREGADAVRTYQSIVDNFPQSEWADDALYKVYQFYYALGLYRTAELKLAQLKSSYPASPYGGEAADDTRMDHSRVPVVPSASPQPSPVPPVGTEATADPAPQTTATPAETAPSSPEIPSDTAIPVRFSLQVGAFTLYANAETQKARFESLGYATELVSKVRNTRALFIVLVGDYATYDEAKTAAAGVKTKLNIDTMVISR